MIVKSFTINSLATELGMDRRALTRKLQGLTPAESIAKGARTEHRYRLADVVAHLIARATPERSAADPDQMTPKDRLDHFRAERERTKHMEEAGQLIRAADYERALSSALKIVAVTLESLPDVLERDAGIDGAAVERCQIVIDRVREDLYRQLTTVE